MKELFVIDKPNSTFGEEIKKTRTNLMYSNLDDDMRIVMITSSLPGEGKSFISANLAAAFSQASEKVLLMDCDLRKGRLKKMFNIPPEEKGLSDLLINKNWKEEINNHIIKTEVKNLSVMVTGAYPPNPSELLSSKRFQDLLNNLKNKFKLIILDCPPVVGLNDAMVLAKKSDRCVLVANTQKVSMEGLEQTKNELEKVGVKITGVILNEIENKNRRYKYKYNYYNRYYRDE